MRTGVVVLGVAALVALAMAILPTSAAAQAADDEYSLNIPGTSSGGGDGSASQSSSGAATTAGGDTEPSAATSAEKATAVTQSSGSSTGDNGGGGGSQARGDGNDQGARADRDGPGANAGSTPPTEDPAPAVTADPAADSGAPTLLIVLAVIAALGTAAAIWRLRNRARGEDHGIDADSAVTATGEP